MPFSSLLYLFFVIFVNGPLAEPWMTVQCLLPHSNPLSKLISEVVQLSEKFG